MSRVDLSDRLLKSDKRVEFKGKIALVLSGGGARGAYQIGVWKALKDCGVQIGGVYGTSVGAINATAIAMDRIEEARDLWLRMDFSSVVKDGSGNNLVEKIFAAMVSGGFDNTPLRECFERLLDEESVRNSGIDMGIVTYSLSGMEPRELYIEDIPQGELADYVLASANHPVFKRAKIDDEKFIDGGVYRNIPINMALEKGFEEIVVVDLGPKRLRDVLSLASVKRSKEVFEILLTPEKFYGDVLDFDPELSAKYMREGYLDGLKALGFLKGSKFYIHAMQDILGQALFSMPRPKKTEILKIFGIEKWQSESTHHFYYGQLLAVLQDFFDTTSPLETVIALLESMAEAADLPRFELYSIASMAEAISKADPGAFQDLLYNDINGTTIAEFLSFLLENSSLDKLQGDEYLSLRKSFDGFSPACREPLSTEED